MSSDILATAYAIASLAHGLCDQRRKYTGDPYLHHPLAVANLIHTEAECPVPLSVLAAAMLHDVLEDTPVTEAQLREAIGEEVTNLVLEVTDVSKPGDGNRAARKRIDREHLARASPEGQTIKLADLSDNTQSIVVYDPQFARTYLREKSELLAVLTKGDVRLQSLARRSLELGWFRLAEGDK